MMTQPRTATSATTDDADTTRLLLGCGIVAGPVYFAVSLVQALLRPGFDLTRHPLSLLSTGDLGWIQITNFLVCGALVLACAVGLRRALRGERGGTWGPLLVGLFGLGLIGGGIFVADPVPGFPPEVGTTSVTITTRGLLHFVVAEIGFLGLVGACFVFARRFAALGQTAWARFSVLAGALFVVGLVAIAAGGGQSWSILAFWIGIVLAWSWLSALAAAQR
jgi:hypothetical protein